MGIYGRDGQLRRAMMNNRVSIAVGIALTIAVFAAQPAGQGSAPWSAAARARPIEFALSLANASIPVGVETSVAERLPHRKPALNLVREPSLSVDALASAFNSSHTNERAEVLNGVLVIRPVTRRARYLDQPLPDGDLVLTGAMFTLRRIFAGLDPRLDSGGIVGSRLAGPEESGDDVTITLTPGGTVLRALNEMTAQTRQGWLVVAESSSESGTPDIVEIALLHRGGSASRVPLSSQR
jgi:hypothetical protein